jgi:hypothetical protein
MELTSEQKEKLRKLDIEMKQKSVREIENKQWKIETSKKTGIPTDIVDLDVIKIGMVLGIINNLDVFEGREKAEKNSLLDIFLGNDEEDEKEDLSAEYEKIPSHYAFAPIRTTEQNKYNYHAQYVRTACDTYNELIKNLITQRIDVLCQYIYLSFENYSVESYVNVIKENINIVLQCLETEDDVELWEQLSVLRMSLLPVIHVCDYKLMINDHIKILTAFKKSNKKILSHLTPIESVFTLASNFKRNVKYSDEDKKLLYTELLIRKYTKDPSLRVFNFEEIVSHCCVVSTLFIPIKNIIQSQIIGPYMNNSIGWLTNVKSFYVLNKISGKIRLWVMDYNLITFSQELSIKCAEYCCKLFNTFYKSYFETNNYISGFWLKSEIFVNLLNSIQWLSSFNLVNQYVKEIIQSQAQIIPTELDAFNTFQPYPTIKIEKISIPKLFNTETDSHFKKYWNL